MLSKGGGKRQFILFHIIEGLADVESQMKVTVTVDKNYKKIITRDYIVLLSPALRLFFLPTANVLKS